MKGRGRSARISAMSSPRDNRGGTPAKPEVAGEYRVSRSVLLDTLEVLESKRDSLTIIGAHAVYINEQESSRFMRLPVAPMTTDCDISIDPSLVGGKPLLADLMENAE